MGNFLLYCAFGHNTWKPSSLLTATKQIRKGQGHLIYYTVWTLTHWGKLSTKSTYLRRWSLCLAPRSTRAYGLICLLNRYYYFSGKKKDSIMFWLKNSTAVCKFLSAWVIPDVLSKKSIKRTKQNFKYIYFRSPICVFSGRREKYMIKYEFNFFTSMCIYICVCVCIVFYIEIINV